MELAGKKFRGDASYPNNHLKMQLGCPTRRSPRPIPCQTKALWMGGFKTDVVSIAVGRHAAVLATTNAGVGLLFPDIIPKKQPMQVECCSYLYIGKLLFNKIFFFFIAEKRKKICTAELTKNMVSPAL
jgi:hypothetical protein